MSERIEMALDYIDSAIDLLRELAAEDERLAEFLEDVLYHLEEAAEMLHSTFTRSWEADY